MALDLSQNRVRELRGTSSTAAVSRRDHSLPPPCDRAKRGALCPKSPCRWFDSAPGHHFRGLGPSCRSERTGARWHDKACRRARISGRTAPLTVSQAARFCALRSRSPDDRPRYSPPHSSRTMQLLSRRDHGLALACDRAEPGRFVLSSSNSSASRPATRDISRRCSSHRQRPREGARMICCVTYLRT